MLKRDELVNYEKSNICKLKAEKAIRYINELDQDIKEIEYELREMPLSNDENRETIKKLLQIPCVGELTSIIITSEL
ncbi:MAG: hypothetical protein SVR08_06515 [Spirochaetota bacterium]|nr:hypothetical protein [Spirochaetota bacterium]